MASRSCEYESVSCDARTRRRRRRWRVGARWCWWCVGCKRGGGVWLRGGRAARAGTNDPNGARRGAPVATTRRCRGRSNTPRGEAARRAARWERTAAPAASRAASSARRPPALSRATLRAHPPPAAAAPPL
eukprot:2865682-Prymnesium_polylepis.1